jgi:hypothetical protein
VAAGAQYGVAPQAIVHPVRVFNCSRHEDADDVASAVIAGLQWIQQTATFHYPGEPAVVVRDLTDVALNRNHVQIMTRV